MWAIVVVVGGVLIVVAIFVDDVVVLAVVVVVVVAIVGCCCWCCYSIASRIPPGRAERNRWVDGSIGRGVDVSMGRSGCCRCCYRCCCLCCCRCCVVVLVVVSVVVVVVLVFVVVVCCCGCCFGPWGCLGGARGVKTQKGRPIQRTSRPKGQKRSQNRGAGESLRSTFGTKKGSKPISGAKGRPEDNFSPPVGFASAPGQSVAPV